MFHLTREVRLILSSSLEHAKGNSYAGGIPAAWSDPTLLVRVTLAGPRDARSDYVVDIRRVDSLVRELAPVHLGRALGRATPLGELPALVQALDDRWAPTRTESLSVQQSPWLQYGLSATPMSTLSLVRLYEFSAAHRLHNSAIDDAANREVFGKCNNPAGHGHNYQVAVRIEGVPGSDGVLFPLPRLDAIVGEQVLSRFDHKHLNSDTREFASLIPSVENIARVCYELLEPHLQLPSAHLASVTVWETPKTWCEYRP